MNNSVPFEVTTGTEISSLPPEQEPMIGTVILPTGGAPKEAILYVTAGGAQVTSTLVKKDGTFILPLNSIRTTDLSSYYNFPQNGSIDILVIGDTLTSSVQISTSQIHPVPTITLSNNYDFRSSDIPTASGSANLESFPDFSSLSTNTASSSPLIASPRKDQGYSDPQPLFRGKGVPDEEVEIEIHSQENIQTKVTTDKNGNWSFRPTEPLSPGKHTITIRTKDSSGILRTITQTFTVFLSGTQVAEAATPSATLTPTRTPTPSPTPTKTPTPTPTKIPGVTITPTITPTPTSVINTPTPTLIASYISPTPTDKPLPATGNTSIMTAGIIGVVVTLIGGLLFLITRGGISAL
jgi:hypothetical protein